MSKLLAFSPFHLFTFSLIALSGCTAESTRIAIETQQRCNEVDEAVFNNQHDGLTVLLYRDAVSNLEKTAPSRDPDDPASPPIALTSAQRDGLNQAWNQRDLVEFWRVQHERSKALRLIGVDAKLYGDQSIIDLLYKSLDAKVQRARSVGKGVGQVESSKPAADAP
jgi:hypothetical protein